MRANPRVASLTAYLDCPEEGERYHSLGLDLTVRDVRACHWVRFTLVTSGRVPAGRDTLYRGLIHRRAWRLGPLALYATWMPEQVQLSPYEPD